SVQQWIADNAVAIQVDGAAVERFSAKMVPTVIVMRDGIELDRVSGGRGPRELLAWLTGLVEGKTELQRLRETPREDLHNRLRLAETLVLTEHDEEALEEFVWLWEHSLETDSAWYGVRGSFLIAALEPLVARSTAARSRFAAIRDAIPLAKNYHDWL